LFFSSEEALDLDLTEKTLHNLVIPGWLGKITFPSSPQTIIYIQSTQFHPPPPLNLPFFLQISPKNRQKAPYFCIDFFGKIPSATPPSSLPFAPLLLDLHETPKKAENLPLNALFPFFLFTALYSLSSSACPSSIVPHCFCHPRARASRFFLRRPEQLVGWDNGIQRAGDLNLRLISNPTSPNSKPHNPPIAPSMAKKGRRLISGALPAYPAIIKTKARAKP
jgi:hypothetical protein